MTHDMIFWVLGDAFCAFQHQILTQFSVKMPLLLPSIPTAKRYESESKSCAIRSTYLRYVVLNTFDRRPNPLLFAGLDFLPALPRSSN
jgi:hypothetical protein